MGSGTERECYRRVFVMVLRYFSERERRLPGAAVARSFGDRSHSAIREVTGIAMPTLPFGVA